MTLRAAPNRPRRTIVRWLAVLLAACAAASAGADATPDTDGRSGAKPASVEAYAAIPRARGARLSPGGRYLAYIGALAGHTALVIQDLDGREPLHAVPTGEGELNWILWKSEQRLVVSIAAVSTRLALQRTRDTRLIALDRDGGHLVELVKAEDADFEPQLQDQVVSELPADPDHLLLQLPKVDRYSRTPASLTTIEDRILHPEVVRVDVNTGLTQTVVRQSGVINDWVATPEGAVSLGWSLKRDKSFALLTRDASQSTWKPVLTMALNQGEEFDPLAFVDQQPGRIYVASNHEGGHLGLYEFDLATSRYVRTLKADARMDVEPIVKAGRLVGYEDSVSPPVYLDAAWAADERLVDKALPEARSRIVDRSRDGKRVLLQIAKGNEPNDFWLLTRGNGKADLEPITDAYPALAPEQIASSRWVSYDARDGLPIPAILTLPVGYVQGRDASPLPFVVLPHGGPSAHDEKDFDYWVQFLASRGYGALQPQFRGSTGFGRDFLVAGYRQWGLAMQDDVTDGTHWLVRQGPADPRRIAIVGASYGGYAALMGVAKETALYRCAVAIAPVTDLLRLIEDERHFLFADLNLPQIGEYRGALEETSPLYLADRIQRPVLLIHGRKDYTVPVQHTETMSRALARAGKPVQTVLLDDADHYFKHTPDRVRLLHALEDFLGANIN